MTYDDYASYIKWRADLLMSGRLEDLARHYELPTAIDLAGRQLTLTSRDDVVLHLHRSRLVYRARGIEVLESEITAVELPTQTQRVWINWTALDACGANVGRANSIYTMNRSRSGMRVQAIENPTLLVPEFALPHYRNRLIRSRA
jgi:hypothetical protein